MSRRSDFRFENLVLVLFTLSFAGLFVVASQSESYNFDGIASMSFPKWIIGFVIVLCIVKLVMNYVSHPKSNSSEETGKGNGVINGLTLQERRTKIGVSLVAIVLYAVLWKVFGFALCTIVYVTFQSKYFRPSVSWKRCVIVGFGTTIVLYFIFGFLFKVDFPEPFLELIG